jgi:hypothetical protein
VITPASREAMGSLPPVWWVEAWEEGGKVEGLSGMLPQNGEEKKSDT